MKTYKPFYYLFGGLIIFSCWFLISQDINDILKNEDIVDTQQPEILKVIFIKYLFLFIGGSFTIIGIFGILTYFKRKH